MKKKLHVVLILLISQLAFAQEHAWVYFTDKEDVSQSIANPISILTQEAIDRKKMHGISIDARDVPVNENYITIVKEQPGITVHAKSKWFNCVHVIGDPPAIDALHDLAFVARVVYANKNLNTDAKYTISKKKARKLKDKFDTQIDFTYGNTVTQVQMLNVHLLHQKEYTGEGMVIAVMDAGFPNVNTMNAFQRMRNNGDLLGGYNFVAKSTNYADPALSSHGTRVLSDMAGYIENEFVGTAPDASYYLFITEDASGETPAEESYWVEAAERADSLGVDIINTSLGYSTFDNEDYNYTTTDMDGNTTFITRGANIAVEKGILVVCSAGNSGNGVWGIVTAPGDGNVFTVGAVDALENYASFSSRGPTEDGRIKPDAMAMGQQAAVIGPDNMIYSNNGTSFSSPIMAGAIASLWQATPGLTNLELMQYIRESSSNYTSPNATFGYGIPDFERALDTALSATKQTLKDASIYPNPVPSYFMVDFPASIGEIKVEVYNILGKRVISQKITTENNTVNATALSKGIYMVRLSLKEDTKIFKIVKQ